MYSPAKKAGLPACTGRGGSLLQHHYRHCEDIAPQRSSSALRNDNFPTILEAESEEGPRGKVHRLRRKCKFLPRLSGGREKVDTGA